MAAAAAAAGFPGGAVPVTRVELSFSAQNLVNKDTLSKSDPLLVLYSVEPSGRCTEVGRTERIKDTLNPKWQKSFVVDYYFEEVQMFRVAVFDVDNTSSRLEDQDFLGEALAVVHKFTLGEVVGARGQRATKRLEGVKSGVLCIQAEEQADIQAVVRFWFSARKLDKKDFFGSSDPFLCVYRTIEASSPVLVYKTEEIRNNINPTWRMFEVPIAKLCNGDYDRPLLLEVWDWNRSGTHELIGSCQATLRQLQSAPGVEFELIEENIRRKKGAKYQNSGYLICNKVEVYREPTFLEYIAGGCEMSLIVAIDFTASNGDPRSPQSLHFLSPYQPNEYYKAIAQVGEILQYYDRDQRFPAFGFGAKIPPSYTVSHCFPLNFNYSQPEVFGVQGILEAYMAALRTVTLYGPTNFSEIIHMAMGYARQYVSQESQHYFVLLIITDGEITDMDNTVAAIVEASSLPLSIVIVGVGSADFGNMKTLDGDEQRLSSRGRYAERDIVQFVPFREYRTAPAGRLAKDTLAEIPGQLLSFMKKMRIVPNPPYRPPPPPPPPPPPAVPAAAAPATATEYAGMYAAPVVTPAPPGLPDMPPPTAP